MSSYDVIVVGLGGMGSATAAHLARRGLRVLGLENFRPNHGQGSSHGQHRIIREAYFEDPAYVPLVQRAYTLWRELELETGRDLLRITGGLNIGGPDSEFVTGSRRSALEHGLPHEQLSAVEVHERFPGFRLADDLVAIYEPNAGFVRPEACVAAHLEVAAQHGAELRYDEPVTSWSADGASVRVETARGAYAAGRLVLTPGPWAAELLADMRLPIEVWRIVNAHFEPLQPELYTPERCPIYLFSVPEGDYYGFPQTGVEGVKLGRHDRGEVCTPRTIRRQVSDAEVEMLRAALATYLPGAAGPLKATLTCMYSMTPDRHFILDRHPEHDNVAVGCGFSGHGFKFAAAIGEVLADLATEGRTRFEIDFLSARRFAV